MSGNVDWKKYNKLTDKGKNVIFFTKKDPNPLVWQISNGREVQATDLKGSKSSYKSYKVKDIYKILVEAKLTEGYRQVFYGFYKGKKMKFWADFPSDAKKYAIDAFKAPKSKWGEVIILSKSDYDQQQSWHKQYEGKLKEYRIRGNADNLLIRKGDIKKGMMVWFEDGKGSAKKLKVKHVMLSKDGKEEHYVTNKGTFTPRDVVGY